MNCALILINALELFEENTHTHTYKGNFEIKLIIDNICMSIFLK